MKLRNARVLRRIRTRRRQAKLRRLEHHLPEGSYLNDGSIVMSGIEVGEFLDQLEQSYRFWRLRRRWNRAIRPIRTRNLRFYWSSARSRIERARHGIGSHDTWSLGHYLCRVAARGLRILAETPKSRPPDSDVEDWLHALHEHAGALETWTGSGD